MENQRRLFLKSLVLGLAAVALSPFVKLQNALAGDLVKDTDPLVKALGYVAKAKDSKDRKDKKAQCSNCQFYADATGKAKQAKCQLIPTGEVAAEGWCRSYSVRAKKA
jgi:hypothetical protein